MFHAIIVLVTAYKLFMSDFLTIKIVERNAILLSN